MDEKLTWDDMLDSMYRYFNSCPDDEFVQYYNKIFCTNIKVEDIV